MEDDLDLFFIHVFEEFHAVIPPVFSSSAALIFGGHLSHTLCSFLCVCVCVIDTPPFLSR